MNSNKDSYYPSIDFQQGVFRDELDEINRRKLIDVNGEIIHRGDSALLDFDQILIPPDERSECLNQVLADLSSEKDSKFWDDDKSVGHKGLVGLAFSGGGIRSATVNLGVLQGLRKTGLLKCVDYISTVSGGGYIGACFSAANTSLTEQNKNSSDTQKGRAHDDLFRHQPGVPESSIFRHLRNNANYMAPGGLIDILRVPSIFLRGIAINFFLVLPYILILAVISAALMSPDFHPLANFSNWLASKHIVIRTPFIITKCLLVCLLLIYLLSPVVNALFQNFEGQGANNWQIRNRSSQFLGCCIAAIMVSALIELQPLAIHLYSHYIFLGLSFEQMTIAGGVGSAALSVFATKLLPKLSSLFARLGVYSLGLIGGLVFWLLYLHLTTVILSSPVDSNAVFAWTSPLGFIALSVILGLFSVFTGDPNFTSLSRFYRDRLSKAYMVGLNDNGEVKQMDSLKLSELDSTFTPYHLINATLNLETTSEAYSSDRRGDFFLFSKRYIGSVTTGYCRTKDMEASNGDVNLATAMAISAAAAAPNVGKGTIKSLVFILAMLNIRYDYWLSNPGRLKISNLTEGLRRIGKKLNANKTPLSPISRVGPLYFIRELFSNLCATSPYVNLSDGGHIENLGLYELIRRECRLIIAGDSEADLTLTFSGLADLIRLVQIDFGVIIVMQGLDDIRSGKQHHAVGTIYYKNNKVGKLIYLKTSLLGDASLHNTLTETEYVTSKARNDDLLFDNNPYIAHYKTVEPAFPHQSSSNQFYNETQFESYRALGYQIATSVLIKNMDDISSSNIIYGKWKKNAQEALPEKNQPEVIQEKMENA